MSVGVTEDQVAVLFKPFYAKVFSITCSYPLRIWYVLPAFVMWPSLIQAITYHLVSDRLMGSSTYSKIIFSLKSPADPIGQASAGYICD